jgi:AraC-like DNA-binding protein
MVIPSGSLTPRVIVLTICANAPPRKQGLTFINAERLAPMEAIPTSGRGLVSEGSVRVGALMALPEVLDELGADTDALLAAEAWRRGDFEDPESVMPARVFGRLLRRGADATGCDDLGLRVGSRASLSGLGALGFLMAASPTVGDALRTMARHFHVHDRAAVISMVTTEGHVHLGYELVVPELEARDQIYSLVSMVGINIMRALCGNAWRVHEVHLPFRQPAAAARLRAAAGAPIHFGAARMELVFPADDLARPLAGADRLLYRMMAERIAELETRAPRGLPEQVTQQLRTMVLTAHCTPGLVATRLGLSPRSLNRRLAELGTSVRALRDAVRSATACQLLEHSERSAAEVGRLLGYAEAAAFTRAFRRWNGLAPAQWRAQSENAAPARNRAAERPAPGTAGRRAAAPRFSYR